MTPPKPKDPAKNRRAGVAADNVNKRLEDIEEYLTEWAKIFNQYDWTTSPLRLGAGGQGTGSNPPKWPP